MAPKAGEFDTAKWLKEDLGFSDADVTLLLPKFEPVKAKVSGGILRQADYSRVMNEGKAELTRLQTELKAKDDQLNNEMAQWAALQGNDDKKAAALREELEQTRLEKFQLEQRVRTLADEHGLDVAKLLPAPKPGEVPPVTKPAVPAIDPATFISREQFGGVTDYLISLPAELQAISNEHYTLTGQILDTRPLVAELKARVAKKQPADLRAIWEESHKIPDLRTTKATEKYNADIKAAEDRGREAARSEAQLPGQHATGSHAPVFTRPGAESKLQRPQPGVQTRNFAESLRSRKYVQGPAAPGAGGAKP